MLLQVGHHWTEKDVISLCYTKQWPKIKQMIAAILQAHRAWSKKKKQASFKRSVNFSLNLFLKQARLEVPVTAGQRTMSSQSRNWWDNFSAKRKFNSELL